MSLSILYPSPCLPALLRHQEHEFDVIVSADRPDDDSLRTWAAALMLSEVGNGTQIRLRTEAITIEDIDALPEVARPAATLAERRGQSPARLRLRCLDPVDPTHPRRARVFHLTRGGAIVRPRCVATWNPSSDVLRIAFASDLHVAAIWDDIADTLQRFTPDLAPRLLHPGKLVEGLITELTAFAERGELDALILGGDLLDHVYRQRRGAATNAALLLDRLCDLPVPVFAIPGNHDFRLFPWRPRIYPFDTAGIPQHRARQAMRQAGLWDSWPMNPRDLDAVRTRSGDHLAALDHHLAVFASAADYTVVLGDLRLIFMSTGRDILPRWRTVERGRAGMLLKSIPISYEHPDSEGFSQAQLTALQSALAGCRNAALFFHAPLLNPLPGTTVGPRLRRLDPGDDDGLPARLRFERQLFRSGHRHGVFFRNPAPFVRTLHSFRGSLATFSGHVHGTHAVELDPGSMGVRSVSMPNAHSSGVHALLNAPALGQTATRNGEPPGYLLARFEGGRLASVERRTVSMPAAAPLPDVRARRQ